MYSPHVQESGDDKTLDEHSEGEEWSESCISMNLYDDGNLRMSRNKLCTKENSKKKIKENFSWHKSTGKSRNVDGNEIEQYFGILLLMSVIRLEREKHMF